MLLLLQRLSGKFKAALDSLVRSHFSVLPWGCICHSSSALLFLAWPAWLNLHSKKCIAFIIYLKVAILFLRLQFYLSFEYLSFAFNPLASFISILPLLVFSECTSWSKPRLVGRRACLACDIRRHKCQQLFVIVVAAVLLAFVFVLPLPCCWWCCSRWCCCSCCGKCDCGFACQQWLMPTM